MSQPWTVRYRPQTTREIAGNKPALDKIRLWLDSWSKEKPSKAAVLLFWPAGGGKKNLGEAGGPGGGGGPVLMKTFCKRGGGIFFTKAGAFSKKPPLVCQGR